MKVRQSATICPIQRLDSRSSWNAELVPFWFADGNHQDTLHKVLGAFVTFWFLSFITSCLVNLTKGKRAVKGMS
jgi:hypothetical protein